MMPALPQSTMPTTSRRWVVKALMLSMAVSSTLLGASCVHLYKAQSPTGHSGSPRSQPQSSPTWLYKMQSPTGSSSSPRSQPQSAPTWLNKTKFPTGHSSSPRSQPQSAPTWLYKTQRSPTGFSSSPRSQPQSAPTWLNKTQSPAGPRRLPRSQPMSAYECFQDKCRCTKTVAICSHNYGRLTFVPQLPKNIRHLDFSYNNLTTISTADFFTNVTNIVSLDLRHNGLETIHAEAFRPLLRLESLTLNGNRLFQLNLSMFLPPSKLTSLRATDSRVTSLTTACLPQLTQLDLQSNALYDLPDSCVVSSHSLFCGNSSSLFPNLRNLSFGQNKLSDFETDTCLPRLESLDLSANPISVLHTDMFNGERFPKLTELILKEIQPFNKIEKFAFRNPKLETLSLMFCSIPFSNDYVHPDCFLGMPRLTYLELSHNLASYLPDDKFQRLFGSLTSLRHFNLGTSGLLGITKDTFATMPALRTLQLYRNKLAVVPDGAFDSLTNLTSLVLSDNEIRAVYETTFSWETRQRLGQLDLSGNVFDCDCDLMWFKTWFDSAPALFNHSYRNYSCSNLPHALLNSFHLNDQACLLSHEACRSIIASFCVFVALLLAVCCVYQYRWHIRLLLAFRGHSDIMRRRLQRRDFDYDLFVSFAGEDLAWVRRQLAAVLEERMGLRLCIHERDFQPGKNILNNIVDSVKGSKRYLMVFSRHFALSPWCQFELDLCLGHALDNGDALIVTCVGDVESRDLSSTMMAVLRTTTYIRWTERPQEVTSFWRKLTTSLRDLVPPSN